jgi:AmmeMemoRadiSam system protein B/AmmeMemoRadiSam system protein A
VKKSGMKRLLIYLLFSSLTQAVINQESMQSRKTDRQPAVAGSFYPSDPAELKKMISGFLANAVPNHEAGPVRAILAPHAGYVFSGGVAASAYNQLDPDHEYKRVFILGSSHRFSFSYAAVYDGGNYITPLGRATVDTELAGELMTRSGVFKSHPAAHSAEHSIEVQLPFLQSILKHSFKIVPIILGTQDPAVCREIAEGLKPWFTDENLFVISADFSHYPSYENARRVDEATAQAFCSGSPSEFLAAIQGNDKLAIPALATSMCAWPSALTFLYLAQSGSKLTYQEIEYKNSGDIKPYGDKSSVVGYYAICVTGQKDPGFSLTETDKRILTAIARKSMDTYVRTRSIPRQDSQGFSKNLLVRAGAFVSLKINGELRGCIGSFQADVPLYQVVQNMAIASATQDSRFKTVTEKELGTIDIEISVLTPMRKVNNINEIQLGKDGIYIKRDSRSGTFLPQVATETGWTLEEFLGHCSRDKAGIGWTGWKDAEIFIYQAIVFQEDKPGKN